MKFFLGIFLIVSIFSLLPVVYGPSVCPEDTNEDNECVYYGTNILMFPINLTKNTSNSESQIDESNSVKSIEVETMRNSLNESTHQKMINDNQNATIINRNNIWFNEILQRHEQLMQEINEYMFGNVTNSDFGINSNEPINYFGTHVSRLDDKILQKDILSEIERANSKFCDGFGKFVNFPKEQSQNQTEIVHLWINDIQIEFGEYEDSNICGKENDFKITISSKDSKILELTELIKTWAENNK